jgi:hypothetical protein
MPSEDFTDALPTWHRAEEIELRALEVARSAAARHGIALLRGQVQHSPAAWVNDAALLPKVEVTLGLRGEYRALKASLDETLQRIQPAVLRSLSMQRGPGGSTDVEASAVFVLPFRPGSVGGAAIEVRR